CPDGKFGGKCENDCYCQNGATCHMFNGACKCPAGWKGIACDIVSPRVTFNFPAYDALVGDFLTFACNFNHLDNSDIYNRSFYYNGDLLTSDDLYFNNDTRIVIWSGEERYVMEIYSVADEHAGTYECKVVDTNGDTYTDTLTLTVTGCEINRWGMLCDKICDCKNYGNCSRKVGCVCSEGWEGVHCTKDVGAPEFVFCPHNITALLDEGSSSTGVTWPNVEAIDNSGLFNQTSNHQSGDRFIVGIHNILYTAVDIHGNTALCRFSVNVEALNIGTKKTVIVSLIVTSLLLVVLVTLGSVVCFLYRRQIELIYTTLCGKYEEDDDKEWDAFVAVKGETSDETFVYKVLLPELEEINEYKLIIHHRNFTPGMPIVDNIIHAIQNSRRTILILSPEFIKSDWCNYEVDQARVEMFGLRHKLIPIMFKDVTHMGDEMSATLKSILDTINYLVWPSDGSEKEKKMFWKKLYSAMPRKHQEQHRVGFISRIVNHICHHKRYLRLADDDDVEEVVLEMI
ncbi:uncharacterized protein LOC144355185, partial [Saccoglossus kowalevskii]